ncbi:MAG: DUF47 family protein [Candidatus Parcubacteria bacterium]|nr:DUF47 family protein [Candidatus Parcubacteria bacterium]
MFDRKKDRSFEVIFFEHISLSEICSAKVMQLFTNMDKMEGRIREIIDLEHAGDRLNREVYRTLDASFMTKIEKPDIQELIHQLDEILDGLHDAAYLVDIYGFANIQEESKDITAIIQDMVLILKEKIALMSSRKGLSLEQSQEGHAQLDVLETRADELWRKGVKRSYAEHGEKEFFARKQMIDSLERVTDRCLKAMSVVDSIVRKECH